MSGVGQPGKVWPTCDGNTGRRTAVTPVVTGNFRKLMSDAEPQIPGAPRTLSETDTRKLPAGTFPSECNKSKKRKRS